MMELTRQVVKEVDTPKTTKYLNDELDFIENPDKENVNILSLAEEANVINEGLIDPYISNKEAANPYINLGFADFGENRQIGGEAHPYDNKIIFNAEFIKDHPDVMPSFLTHELAHLIPLGSMVEIIDGYESLIKTFSDRGKFNKIFNFTEEEIETFISNTNNHVSESSATYMQDRELSKCISKIESKCDIDENKNAIREFILTRFYIGYLNNLSTELGLEFKKEDDILSRAKETSLILIKKAREILKSKKYKYITEEMPDSNSSCVFENQPAISRIKSSFDDEEEPRYKILITTARLFDEFRSILVENIGFSGASKITKDKHLAKVSQYISGNSTNIEELFSEKCKAENSSSVKKTIENKDEIENLKNLIKTSIDNDLKKGKQSKKRIQMW